MTASNVGAADDAAAVQPEKTGLRRCLRKRESWPRYWGKALGILAVLLLCAAAFATRFRIMIDPQVVRCIPGYVVYLVDLHDRAPVRDGLYAFRSKDLSPRYAEGTKMMKVLRAMPGDLVEVRDNDQVFINGVAKAWGLPHAQALGQPASHFHGKAILGENQYWALGTSTQSFDSRYWGAIRREDIFGRGYPLF
ncbi:MAG: S26 family signal peptidase [Steroidobacteraceae bacterium]|nr:S26 family signal peptidase [Steroidobacteraceae bacterium]